MSKSKLLRSLTTRLLSLLLVAAILVAGVRVFTTAHAATQRTWTGNNPPATFNNAGNWAGNVAPVAGDDLFFPAGVKRRSIRNNYPNNTGFNSLSFSGSGYNLRKNSLTLTAGINTSNPIGSNQVSLPIRLDSSQTFQSANAGTTLILNGQVNLDGNLLTIAGAGNTTANSVISSSGGILKSGSGILTLAGNNTYTGATAMTAGTLLMNGSQSSSEVVLTGGILGGIGHVGTITAAAGAIRPGLSAPGILNSGNVTLALTTSLVVDLNGTTPGSGYRQLNVSGVVSLGGCVLNASANFQAAVGDTFTIINNDGVDPVLGIFFGLPEGTTLTLGALPFRISYLGGTGNDVVLTRVISLSPPPPTISISDVTVGEGDSGTTQAVFTVSLSANSSQTVTVDYATADGTAITLDDYASASGTLPFDPGETIKTISVPVSGDTLNEDDETFVLDLRNSTNASILDAQGQGSILNDDVPPSLSIEDVSVTEGNSGAVEAIFSVSLSTQSGQTVTVNYATADGTATELASDYDGASGALNFAPGQTDDEVIVAVNGDSVAESDETFFVNLISQTNSTLADAQGLGTIVDDDTVTPTPTPTPTPDPSPTPTPDPTPTPSPTPTPDPTPTPTPTPDPSPTPTPDPTPTPSPTPTPDPTPTPTPTPDPSPTPTPDPTPTPSPTPTPDPSPTPTPTPDPSPTPTPTPSPTPTPDPTPTPSPSPTPDPTPTPTPTPDPSPTPTPTPSPSPTPDPTPTPSPSPTPDPTPTPTPTPSPTPTPTATPTPSPTPTPTPTPTPSPSPTPDPTPTPGSTTIQFLSSMTLVGEASVDAVVTVTRTGDVSGTSTIDYRTTDTDNFTVGCSDTVNNMGSAFGRCDFAISLDTLTFSPGETSKTFIVPIIDDSYAEGNEAFSVVLSSPAGASFGSPSTATVSIVDNDSANGPNPIFNTAFSVRQHYLDFLSREPEPAGFNAWVNLLDNCSDVNNNPTCDRLTVSAAFFGSQEFQLKGYYVYRFYKMAFNRLPTYSEIVVDMRAVTGQTATEVFQKKGTVTDNFVLRPEFVDLYNQQTNTQYVNTLMGRYSLTQITTPDPVAPDGTNKVTLTTTDLVNRLNGIGGTLTRAQVLRAIADSDQVFQLEFNQAFVAMQYYGYLRRTPEPAGFNAWLNYLNANPTDSRTMVNGFLNSVEYRLRFGPQ